ncbi:octanoyl-[GcvH]:protein N-octanoyltransferase [Alkalibacterium putridalgicola]|uniref:Octanoyl-[GcvH]:protein N-octanoyltransferase n=1 Tax=Alkalibacterium putridalgicola TaxID=426703 RepID=A0A1H7WTP8_9LACT|nr:lipoate--protein ligase family protein [Alkalibacterium putridalgicola]GEK90134.1 lipoate--protein ligase A [Alkalibacterium putridalgicola]SEM24771.1 octanoyl-[GcvH]:protein N-octanoyltransferase [Alkalibacterium putridalgicola]
MTDSLNFLNTLPTFLVYDNVPDDYSSHRFAPFAFTDALIKEAGEKKQPILHFWTTRPYVILGMMDTKLPFLTDALRIFSSYGYPHLVRNSGGLAVVSDEGVLNFSLIFPEEDERMPINEGYERMHHIIKTAFKDFSEHIDAYEIPDSYCPGDFDLSIDGKKIAGIAQRRLKGGIAIMIYLSVSGDQQKRAEMIRTFYDIGLKEKETKWDFPTVHPDMMTTLEEALSHRFTVDDVKERLMSVFTDASVALADGPFPPSITASYEEGLEKMIKRNEKMLPQSPSSAEG